jgi:hypothetical protein
VDLEETAWMAATLKHLTEFAQLTVRELTTSIHNMMAHAANEIRGKAHTITKELVVCGYKLVPVHSNNVTNKVIMDVVGHWLDDKNYIHGFYKSVSNFTCIRILDCLLFFMIRQVGWFLRICHIATCASQTSYFTSGSSLALLQSFCIVSIQSQCLSLPWHVLH